MNPAPTEKSFAHKVKFVGALVFVLGMAGFLILGDTGLRQGLDLWMLGRDVPSIRAELAKTPQLRNVTVGVATSPSRAIVVHGEVRTGADFSLLTNTVARVKPPASVMYLIKVTEDNSFRRELQK
ncbi:MAG TPA: hypothetical protein VHH73_00785 [Verrucomicrobiae bacterium]|nr:hypothetical protein [Verrucomicrobiae bacterium]